MYKGILSILLAISVQSCGGGNKTNTTDNTTTPTTATAGSIVAIDEQAKIGQAIDLLLYYPDDQLSDILWQQTEGQPVAFHAKQSKVIAFTPTQSGRYSFSASFLRNGNSQSVSHSVEVIADASSLTARLGHAALEGSKVSLQATLNNSALNQGSLRWQQVSGPNISFSDSTNGAASIFFTAPNVSKDAVIEFVVSASDGRNQYQDNVAILVENSSDIASNANTAYGERLARVFPYVENSPYKDVLAKCVYSNDIDFRRTCRFNELPLIAHDQLNPSVDDIMARVLVSHQWMGKRFKEFLEQSDPHDDFKNLLRATTAIVISYDVRPSFYWVVTGAIHLDANNFWLTPDERDTINQSPDYRASFGDSLAFVMPWRYVKNNNYISYYYPENQRLSRTAADGVYNITALLYHELAHANDFFPQSSWQGLDNNARILDAAQDIINETGTQSDLLAQAHPLQGDEMHRLAQVRFKGLTPTATEQNYQPEDVSHFFSQEDAPQFYNYSSIREDYAMLFDGFMMKARYNIFRDVAVTNQPQSADEQYIVAWGQRGRIGETRIKPRVGYAVARILPEFTQAQTIIAELPSPTPMLVGESWANNLAISANIPPSTATQSHLGKQNQHVRLTPQDGPIFIEKPIPKRINRNQLEPN